MFFLNMVTVLLSMIVTAALLYTQLGNYFKTSVYDNLKTKAVRVADTASFVLDSFHSPVSQEIIRKTIEMSGEGNAIIVTNDEGEVIATSGIDEEKTDLSLITREVVSRALVGETVSAEGHLGGALSENSLYVMVPITVSKGVVGAAIVCRTEPYIRNMQFDVMGLFLSAVMIAAILSFIISAVFSQKLTKPIREMTDVAKKITSGDFSQRVSVETSGEMRVLAATFNQMSESIKEMDDMQSSFISDVSHELRTPMTIISGFVEGVLDGTIPESEQKKYLGIVLSEIKRLNRLVNDLLEMSRLKSGKIEYKMVPFDVNESIRQVIISFDKRLSEKNVDLEVDFSQDSLYAMGSRDSIYRVITNLMDNAVKFTEDGGKITIASKCEGGKVVVSIQNSGSGLSEKELMHIWDRFYQTDKSRSNAKNRGAGLGLYIVKNIMAAHSNSIRAESEEGKWTRFVFELDSVKKPAQPQEEK
jgi:signal transduction histidine kinase